MGPAYSTDISDTRKGKPPKVLHVQEGASQHSCNTISDNGTGCGENAADELLEMHRHLAHHVPL